MSRDNSITLAHRVNYQMELRYGGIGHGGDVSTTPSVARAMPFVPGEQITIYNDGSVAIWFAVGGANILATTSCTPVPPGDKEVFTISKDGGVYTHISWVTRVGDSFATVNLGFGE